MPDLTLRVLPPSHPCKTIEAALHLKGLDFELVTLTAGPHNEEMERVYGEGNRTVHGLLVDGEPVHGSRAIPERLAQIAPEPALYPDPIADAVREAERWGDEELQDLGRRMPWGALHFRPEAMGSFAGSGALAAEGVVGGESATAADLQIGATLRVLLTIGDLRPLIEGRPAERVARSWFPDYAGDVPAGAFPAGWVRAAA